MLRWHVFWESEKQSRTTSLCQKPVKTKRWYGIDHQGTKNGRPCAKPLKATMIDNYLNERRHTLTKKRKTILLYFLCNTKKTKWTSTKAGENVVRRPRTRSPVLLKQAQTAIVFYNAPPHRFEHLIQRESPSTDCVETKMDSFSPSTHRGYGNDKSWGVPIFMTQTRGTHFVSGVEIEGKIRNFVFSGLNLRLSFPWSD